MRSPLAPVHACGREPATLRSRRRDVNSWRGKVSSSPRRNVVCAFGAVSGRQPAQFDEAVVQRHPQPPSDVIETSSRRGKSDPESRANLAMAQTKRVILREERTFLEVVDATFEISVQQT